MNIYIRYFDHEAITHSFDELIDYIDSIGEIPIDKALVDELSDYINSDMPYPKRYKVRPRVYFILIKTNVDTLEQFKANRRAHLEADAHGEVRPEALHYRDDRMVQLLEQREGWYFGKINFKRVVLVPGTQKFQYRDTTFSAYVWANSGQHCYQRIIEHLRNRQDVDARSQLPSMKGNNFSYEYLGAELPLLVEEMQASATESDATRTEIVNPDQEAISLHSEVAVSAQEVATSSQEFLAREQEYSVADSEELSFDVEPQVTSIDTETPLSLEQLAASKFEVSSVEETTSEPGEEALEAENLASDFAEVDTDFVDVALDSELPETETELFPPATEL